MILKDSHTAKEDQKAGGVLSVMLMVMLGLLIQLWLLNIAVEEYLAAHTGLAVPTFLASLLCFALNLAGLKYLYLIDSKDA